MILSVLLTVLKIIGIILLVLLGIVLFLLIIILFVPIRYKAKFSRTGAEGDPPVEFKGYASWILHIVHISFDYQTEMIVCARIFGIPLKKKNKDKEDDKTNSDKSDKKFGKKRKNKDSEEEKKKDDELDSEPEIKTESKKQNSKSDVEESNEINDSDLTDIFTDDDISGEDDDFAEENESVFERISGFFDSVKCTLAHVYDIVIGIINGSKDKVEEAVKNVKYYYTIFTSDLFDRTFEKAKKKLFRFLKSILPQYFDMNIEVGFEDPATTGQVVALYSTLYYLLWKHVHLEPNFDENIIRGKGKLRGRIYGISILIIVIYYFTDKDLKKLLRLLKKEVKKNGRK